MKYLNVLAVLLVLSAAAMAQGVRKFDFGTSNTSSSTKVLAGDLYSSEKGFGFEPDADIKCAKDGCTSDKPFYFSAKVPEGNYRVTVGLGNSSFATAPVIKPS